MTNLPPTASDSIDFRMIFEIPLRQFVIWLVMVLLVTFVGYPGVVCVTPMAWLIALRVGILCVTRSRSDSSSRRILEATLAGGLLGLLQGILFIVIVPLMGPIQANEWSKTIDLTLIMIVVGVFAGAGLSLFTAYLTERKRGTN